MHAYTWPRTTQTMTAKEWVALQWSRAEDRPRRLAAAEVLASRLAAGHATRFGGTADASRLTLLSRDGVVYAGEITYVFTRPEGKPTFSTLTVSADALGLSN